MEKVRAEGRAVAEAARAEIVEPLKEEVERIRQQLEEAQALYEVQVVLTRFIPSVFQYTSHLQHEYLALLGSCDNVFMSLQLRADKSSLAGHVQSFCQ